MKNVLMIIQMIPTLIDLIIKIESLMPDTGMGKEKLSLIKALLGDAYEGLSEMWPQIETIISTVVFFLNKWKVFKQDSTPITE